MRTTVLLLLSGCSSVITYSMPEGSPPPMALDDTAVEETAADDTAADDTSTDTAPDTAPDTSTDTAPDTSTDTAADTSTDTALDTSTDTGVGPTAGTVSAYTGTWSPSATPVELGVGVHPWHVHTADFDDDGRADLAYTWNVELFGGDELHIAVHLQDGTGALGPATHLFTGHDTAFAGSFRAGDLDGDGDADLVAGHDDGVSVFLSDGAGAFTGPTDLLSGDSSAVRIGDLDGDGHADLVAVGTDGSVQVWIGDGAGGFTAGFAGATSTSTHGEAAALGDLDDDGDLDLVIGDPGGMAVLFRGFLNDGTGTFDLAGYIPAPSTDPAVTDLEAFDVNGDGVDDIVATGALVPTYEIFVGAWSFDGTGFVAFTDLARPTSSTPTGLTVGDLDGDGADDLFAANALYLRGQLLFNQGGGAWAHQEVDLGLWYQSDVFPDSNAVGDLNSDGCGDLVWRTDLDVVVAHGTGC